MCLLAYGRRITALHSQKLLHSFLIINLIFTFITETTGQSWVEQPKDKNVTVGATVRFPCQARGVQGTHIWNKGTSPIFVDGQRNQGVSDRYQIEGNNTLVIRNVELGDDSFYSCTIFGFDSIQVRLTVLLPPGQPVISINSSSPHVENSVISLNCSSTGGKPTPTVRWLRNGQPITSAILNVPSVEMGTTSSLITVELTKQDDRANFSCIVFNDANVDHPHIGSEILDVQYSPSIQFEPNYSPYYVKLNTRVDLKCVVDANPPVPSSSVQWHKEGSPFRGSTNTLSFNSIQKADSGNYTCTAFNVIKGTTRTARASKVIDVIYAPTVTTQSVIIANISDPVNMTCTVDANPRAREIRWAKVDNSIYANGPNFVFIAQRRYAGNYSCTAVSKLQPSGQPAEDISSTGYTSVQIQYAPGQASISPVSPVLVNQLLVLTCSVDDPGFPLPTLFEWRKAGQQSVLQATSSPSYRIERAQLTNNGEYTCQPRNIIGQGTVATVQVEVNSAPEFVQSLPSNDILTIPISHSKLKLEHVVEGRPAPVVEWYKDGMPVALMPNLYTVKNTQTTFDTYKTRVTTILSFIGSERELDHLLIEDTGNFTCQVMSSIDGGKTSKSTYLSVEFSPITSVEPRIAANLAEMTRIICRIQANPTPVIYWYKQGQRLYNSSQVSMFMTEVSGISRYEGVLQISNTVISDFGEYLCEVNNSKGSMGQRTLLTPRDKPEAPSNLAAVEKTWESVKLKWDPGFNGGYEQTFHIVMRSVHGEKTEPVFPPNANTFNVSRLMPHTSYTFNVYGKNKLGMGANSVGFTTSTDVLMFPPLKEIPEFQVADKQLNIPNDLDHNYCLRVEVSSDNGKVWTVVEPCVPTSEGAVALPQQSATNVNISVCLVYRPEVCGEPTVATIHQEDSGDLTKEQVIIIGCVCAAILIVLLVILIVIICRRMRNNKNYNNDPHSPRTVPQGNGTLQNSKPRAFDNQGMTSLDVVNSSNSNHRTLTHNHSFQDVQSLGFKLHEIPLNDAESLPESWTNGGQSCQGTLSRGDIRDSGTLTCHKPYELGTLNHDGDKNQGTLTYGIYSIQGTLPKDSHSNQGTLTLRNHSNQGTLTHSIHSNPGTLTRSIRSNQGTVTPSIHSNQGTLTRCNHSNQGTLTGSIHSNQGTLTRSIHSNQGTLTRSIHSNQGTLTRSIHSNQGTLTRSIHSNQGTLTRSIHSNQGTPTFNIDNNQEILTHFNHSNQGTLTRSIHSNQGTLTHSICSNNATLTRESHGKQGNLTKTCHGNQGTFTHSNQETHIQNDKGTLTKNSDGNQGTLTHGSHSRQGTLTENICCNNENITHSNQENLILSFHCNQGTLTRNSQSNQGTLTHGSNSNQESLTHGIHINHEMLTHPTTTIPTCSLFDGLSNGAPIDIRNGYPPTQYLPHPMETFPMGDTSYDSHMYDKQYEYEMNRRNANMNGDGYYGDKPGDLSFNSGSPRTPTKDPQQFINLPEEKEKHEGGSFGSGNESGYSTPDPAKPKKVIYEVVV